MRKSQLVALIFALAAASAPGPAGAQDADAPPVQKSAPDAGMPGLEVSKLPFTTYSIQAVVKSHLPAIQACYESAIAEMGSAPQGRVMVKFTILPNGLTSRAAVVKKKTTLKNDRIQDCVLDEVRRWEFPKPDDDLEHPIAYPFDLREQK